MKKFIIILFFLIWLGFAFIPKPIMTAFWTLSCVSAAAYVVYNRYAIKRIFCIDQDTMSLKTNAVRLFYLSLAFLFLSFFNIPKFWGIRRLLFDTAFIARHYQIVVELFFPIAFGYLLYKTNFLFKVPNIILLCVGIYAFLCPYIVPANGPWSVYLCVSTLSLIAFRKGKKWLIFPLLFANIVQSAYVLGWIAMVFVTYCNKVFYFMFHKGFVKKVLGMIVIVTIAIIINFSAFYGILTGDANTLWRWLVWTNEIESLLSTYGTGVGLGAAFITTDIDKIVDNSNMYLSEDGSMHEQMFLVANHNSFLDYFYRFGVLGGILFLLCYFYLIKISMNRYSSANTNTKPYVWWALSNLIYQTFVVLLNPGLEMMQFAISFCMSMAATIAMIFQCNEERQLLCKI